MKIRRWLALLLAGVLALSLSTGVPAHAAPSRHGTVSDLQVVPALKQWTPDKDAAGFRLGHRILVDGSSKELHTVAETFSGDLRALTGRRVPVVGASKAKAGDIVLRLGKDASLGEEGYTLDVGRALTIAAHDPHGVFNGTRSVLQLLKRADTIPAGTARDWPTKPIRSVLVDNTPRHFSMQWWESFFRQMSWFKLNDTNLYIDGAGLTIDQMRRIDAMSRHYYVKVVPQLNMPGHMAQVLPSHPEYQLKNADGSLNPVALDLTNPKAVKWALGLLDTYADVFSSDTWHLGSDEYPSWPGTGADHPQLAAYAKKKLGPKATFWDLFADFQNQADAVLNRHGKSMRVWNDMVRDSDVVRLNRDVTVEYWIKDPALTGLLTPQQLADRGHKLINADAGLLYYDMSRRNLDPRDLYEQFDVNTFTAHQPVDADAVAGARIAVWLAWIGTPMESDAEVLNNLRWDMAGLAQHTWDDETVMSWTEFRQFVDDLGRPPGFIPEGNTITGDPALAVNPDKTVAWFARDADGVLWGGRQHDPASGPWSQTRIATRVAGDPQALVAPDGRVHVLARTRGGQVLHAWQRTPGSDDYRVRLEGHRIDSDPDGFVTADGVGWVARSGDQVEVGRDGEAHRLARTVTGAPAAVVAGGTLHVLAATSTGSVHLWSSGGAWKQADSTQRIGSAPVLVDRDGTAVAIARSADHTLVAADLTGAPSWTAIHQDVVGQPSAVVDDDGTVHVAVRDDRHDVLYARGTAKGWTSRVAWYDFIDDPAIGLDGDGVPTIMGENDRDFLAVVQPGADPDGPWQWAHLVESTTGTPAMAQDAQHRSIYAVTTTYGDLQTGTKWGGIWDWGRDFIVGSIAYPDDTLAPDALRHRVARDTFRHDTSSAYEVFRPSDNVSAPAPTVGHGRLQVSGTKPYFTLLRSRTPVARDADTAVIIDIGSFADTDGPENSLHVGFVQDADNRVMAWYNQQRQRLGFDVVVDGKTYAAPDVPVQLVPGDRLAVTLTGRWLTAYRWHNGRWDRVHTTVVNGPKDMADPAVRAHYHAGFALSGSGGTIALSGFEVRTR